MRRTIVAVASLALAAAAHAQTVRGFVVDHADSAAVPGVVVLLLDDAGNVAARSLTNERGEFRLPAGGPGLYRVRTMRIGFRPVTSDPILLGLGQELTQQVIVAGVPFSLDTVRVERRSTCRMRTDSALATYAIWEQVRTALTATDLSTRARNVVATIVTYERFLDPRSKRIRSQTSTVKSGVTNKPWISLSPDSLQRVGYVAEVNGWSIYTAPDIDGLLSSQFLEDHCFRIAQLTDSGWVGLAFEPAPDRKRIPEIEGTVWLDRRSAELRRMEFRYTHIAREAEDGNAGGEMDFIRTKHGVWAISRWNIRMPVLTQSFFRGEPGNPAMPSGEKIQVKEIKVGGGELALVLRGRDTLWSRPPLTLSGTVMDSTSGRPAIAARVGLKGTALEAVTDSSGRFAIAGVLPGEYTVLVRTYSLDSLAAVWQSWIALSDVRPLELRVPSGASVLAQWCPETATAGTPIGFVTGEVRLRGDSAPARRIGVIAEWLSISVKTNRMAAALVIGKDPKGLDARTDEAGVYRICGVPVNTAFRVRTALDDTLAMPGRIPAGERFARVDVLVDTQTSVVAQRSGAVFTGVVLSNDKRQPIAGVEVSLPQLALRARTNDQGEFRLDEIPMGSQVVSVRQVGYNRIELLITFPDRGIVERQFLLSNVRSLDSVVVVAARPAIPEVEERRRLGIGHLIGREDLAKNENGRMSEVLLRLAGLRVVRATGGGQAWIVGTHGGMAEYPPDALSAAMGAKPACYADVWLDGVRVYEGGATGAMLWDVNSIGPKSLEAVEFYAGGNVPIGYSRPNQECGVLLLWTRRGG